MIAFSGGNDGPDGLGHILIYHHTRAVSTAYYSQQPPLIILLTSPRRLHPVDSHWPSNYPAISRFSYLRVANNAMRVSQSPSH